MWYVFLHTVSLRVEFLGISPDAEQTLIRSLASGLPITSCDKTIFAPAAHCQLTSRTANHPPEVN